MSAHELLMSTWVVHGQLMSSSWVLMSVNEAHEGPWVLKSTHDSLWPLMSAHEQILSGSWATHVLLIGNLSAAHEPLMSSWTHDCPWEAHELKSGSWAAQDLFMSSGVTPELMSGSWAALELRSCSWATRELISSWAHGTNELKSSRAAHEMLMISSWVAHDWLMSL